MSMGSFDLGGKRIDVEHDWSDIHGRFYKLFVAGQEIARTTYKGLRLPEGSAFDKDALQAGLSGVLRRSTRS